MFKVEPLRFSRLLEQVKKTSSSCLWLLLVLACSAANLGAASTVQTLSWDDLVPEDYELKPPLPIHDYSDLASIFKAEMDRATGSAFAQQEPNAPVVTTFDQQQVRLAGYVVPLTIDANSRVIDFLLVPYLRACIHVPPPPSNQIIYVDAEQGLPLDELWEPFWVEGQLQVAALETAEITAGYQLQLVNYQRYTEPSD
ncbi:DUF3299 domain-containing protein [Thiopseudomonas alkaliphila]|uniref:DUF3299 domain-containing protein n=1 Tax=Thiopseudomonas alkaliphila TaxID=1697053 RepID=A0AAW7DSR7_9GAMM|nr:DUF3299 domain-containing protein [Thiopseudomonas alkaliphila]